MSMGGKATRSRTIRKATQTKNPEKENDVMVNTKPTPERAEPTILSKILIKKSHILGVDRLCEKIFMLFYFSR
jgi:hypothetical protein